MQDVKYLFIITKKCISKIHFFVDKKIQNGVKFLGFYVVLALDNHHVLIGAGGHVLQRVEIVVCAVRQRYIVQIGRGVEQILPRCYQIVAHFGCKYDLLRVAIDLFIHIHICTYSLVNNGALIFSEEKSAMSFSHLNSSFIISIHDCSAACI